MAIVDPGAGFSFDGKIGIGSVINACVLFIGFVASWYKIQSKTEYQQKAIEDSITLAKELSRQIQLLSLTIERLSTLSELNEKKWDKLEKK